MAQERTGVFVCSCGPNIGDRLDIERVASRALEMEGVVLAETYGLLCSPKGKTYLEERIRESGLDRVVIAACSPREHESTFMAVCESAGLNPFMMEMANIREQVAWVTPDPDEATGKAIRLVRAAVRRIRRHSPLRKTAIVCDPEVTVIGGGMAGMSASLLLAEAGRRVTLVERKRTLGGYSSERGEPDVGELMEKVLESKEIDVILGAEPRTAAGFFGNFIIGLGDEHEEVRAGSLIIATGCITGDKGEAVPSPGFDELASMLRISTDTDGFPSRKHPSLAPFSTPIDGIHLAGCARGPCSPSDAVRSAEAAVGAVLATLVPGREVETEPRTSVISATLCRGCRMCMEVCAYGAISFSEEEKTCSVNAVLCKGCGSCAAACPSGAVRSLHFTPDQIRSQMAGALT